LTRSGKEIHEGYGLTEASPICTWHRFGDAIDIESVGRAFSCCEVQIFDEQGHKLKTGTTGEVSIKGGNVMKGYYNNKRATDRVLVDGQLRTGDIGNLDNRGFLYLSGLKKKMINICGKNVYPKELERLLNLSGLIKQAEVSQAPHVLLGASISCMVTLVNNDKYNKTRFIKWCNKHISKYKIPSTVIFQNCMDDF
jgi:long-chain acyl-CoA synthetase